MMTAQRRELARETTAGPVFSIVAPVYNEEETVPHFYQRVVAVMEPLGQSFEIRLITRLTAVDIPRDTGDFRLLDRSVVDSLVAMREHHRFMRGLSAWVGFRQEAVLYDRRERFAGTTKYPFNKMERFSVDAITSFSHVPLQLATTFGFVLAGISLLGILVAVIL